MFGGDRGLEDHRVWVSSGSLSDLGSYSSNNQLSLP